MVAGRASLPARHLQTKPSPRPIRRPSFFLPKGPNPTSASTSASVSPSPSPSPASQPSPPPPRHLLKEEMHEPRYHRRPEKGSRNLASCMVATVFLLFLITAGTTLLVFLFKPKNPKIAIDVVQFPTFSSSNGTVNFTFFQYVSVTNPNRDAFTHYDSSLRLLHFGSQVGLVFIPAGLIDDGRTQRMSAKFNLERYPLPLGSDRGGGGGGQKMMMIEIETRMELGGRVRVLRLLTHRVGPFGPWPMAGQARASKMLAHLMTGQFSPARLVAGQPGPFAISTCDVM